MQIKVSIFLIVVLGIGAPLWAEFSEKEIQVSDGVRGKLVTPIGKVATEKAVLLLHGWTGRMDEVAICINGWLIN